MVVVGERLLPGYTIDDAVHIVASIDGDAVLSVAVLDRPDATTVLAVTVAAVEEWDDDIHERLVSQLQTVFSMVSVLESDSAALAMGERLT